MGAGFPGVGPDVRAGLDVRAGDGCPGPVAAGSSSLSFLWSRAHLALVLGLSMVSSGVPEYAQGPCLKLHPCLTCGKGRFVKERVHLRSNGIGSSVHGDDRRMLRIISPPLGKIRPRIVILITMEAVVMDGLVVGRSGRHGAIQVLQGVSGVIDMQKEQTQAILGNTMVSTHKLSIM